MIQRRNHVPAFLVLVPILCCACGGASADKSAAEPGEDRQASVEFILSNLCGREVGITDVTIKTGKFEFHKQFPPKKAEKGDGEGEGGGRGLQFGEEAYLTDERFPPGSHEVHVKLDLDFGGENTETLKGRADMAIAGGPATVDISIRGSDHGCILEIVTQSAGSSDDKCLEPPEAAPEPDPLC